MSEPSTPPAQAYAREKGWRFRESGIPCEWAESYRPGGFHPVHLGDIMNERYEIIRKLGNGSYSTVWLALDSKHNRFVVLKIGARRSRLTLRGGSFRLVHPGGSKRAASVLGTRAYGSQRFLNTQRPPQKILDLRNLQPRRFSTQKTKAILRDVLRGLHFLHSNDIVHGDLQSGNMLFSVRDLNSINVDEVRQDINSSRIENLKRKDGKIDKWAPKYLTVAMPLNDYVLPDEEQHIKMIDLESAFPESEPSPRLVTPVALRAPETNLGGPVNRGNADEALDDDHMIQFAEVLSPLPESMMSKGPRAGRYFGPNGERLDAAVGESREDSLHSGDDLDEEEEEDDFDDDEVEFPSGGFGPPLPCDPLEKLFGDNKPQDVDEDEEKTILSLLRWMLQCEVSKRPTVDQLLEHEWFTT
ncbi:Serine/threonine-protein kinase SRPK like [Verticillium longisporum]|nr:Serine/threonine-protein kinase SRPK like [Verticillium longisporum]KAG7150205.1 Serine/threonine-protein kinase SRPK like [Verticillium longisporum]